MISKFSKESLFSPSQDDWKSLLQEALLELNANRLEERAAIAERAMLRRLDAIREGSDHQAERYALNDGLAMLSVIKKESKSGSEADSPLALRSRMGLSEL